MLQCGFGDQIQELVFVSMINLDVDVVLSCRNAPGRSRVAASSATLVPTIITSCSKEQLSLVQNRGFFKAHNSINVFRCGGWYLRSSQDQRGYPTPGPSGTMFDASILPNSNTLMFFGCSSFSYVLLSPWARPSTHKAGPVTRSPVPWPPSAWPGWTARGCGDCISLDQVPLLLLSL